MDGNLNLYSVSADGRVVTWKLVKNELQFQDALTLKNSVEGQKDFTLNKALCNLCILYYTCTASEVHVHVHTTIYPVLTM